jgi:Fe-S-cluster containining protein
MPEPWYKDGLQFECTRCGKCCSGFPGFVWVNDAEMEAIAEFLGEPLEEVIGLYTRLFDDRRTLRDKLSNDCIFYEKEKGCTIYEVRPRQCRTWPFWESNVRTPKAWERAQTLCPGAGKGELFTEEEITRRVKVIKV